MRRKYRVGLSEEERERVREILNGAETSPRYRRRANALLMADESAGKPMTQEEISKRCGISDVTVYHTIRDYCERGVEGALHLEKRENPPRPGIIRGEKEARIVAVACGKPPEGFSRWSLRLLTEKVIELSIVEKVSYETIRKALKKRNSSPI